MTQRERRLQVLGLEFSRGTLIDIYDAAQTSVCNVYADSLVVDENEVEEMAHTHAINCVLSYVRVRCILQGVGGSILGLTVGEVDEHISLIR
jgi:hypothetical protein